ncbi:MAG: hypothetical protein IJA71_04585 [Clostridia bacterium]|nr:hypothetical protein [Clostridia bacterium]
MVHFGRAGELRAELKGPYGSVAIRAVELTLLRDAWKGAVSPWAQTVEVPGAGLTSKIDLQPDPEQLEQMRRLGMALAAVNDNGLVTVLAFGGKPEEEMTLQATVTEVQR